MKLTNFTTPDFSNYRNNIVGYHPEPLQSIIDTLLESYLNTNLVALNTDSLYYLNSEDFFVGLKNEDGQYMYDYRFSLLELFREPNLNIQSKLEFLEGF